LNRLVALKILARDKEQNGQFTERFTREAQALARLSHPNIVAVHDFGEAGGHCFLVMEFVDGLNLRQIERAGKLQPREALQIIPQICAALQFAHDEGIVHRDIKPENILVDKQGRVKIADFGIAKMLGAAAGQQVLTGARDVVGTPHYMAPEQIEKPATVDHRADIYSLGVVFYEMLTGELPLGKFAPPSKKVEIDVRLDEVVLHALEKEPERRYQQASQVKTAVETIAETSPAQTAAIAAAKTGTGTPLFPPSLGLTFNSRLALNVARTGWVLGCLAALGFVPGLKWMFGFAGFFGLIGLAVLIESLHRLKHRVLSGRQPAGRNVIPSLPVAWR
jgi:serine/threonine protein kinase